MEKPSCHLYVVACLVLSGCGRVQLPLGAEAERLGIENLDASAPKVQACACTQATGGLWATFQVGPETFKQKITNPTAIMDAIAVWRGQSNKTIPVGVLRCSCAGW